jgi:adenylate cyclase
MTETRKLAAILAADVVGYSRLAGADEDRHWRVCGPSGAI